MKKRVKVNAQGEQVADNDPNATGEIEIDVPDENPPAPPRPDPTEMLTVYQQQLLTESRERARLERELREAREAANAPKPPTPEEEKSFFDNPRSATAEIVRRELQQQVGPLNTFVAQQQRDALYTNVKNQMRANPAQFAYLSQVESIMDQIVAQIPEINPNAVVFAYNSALGQYISNGGNLTPSTPAPSPTPAPAVPSNNPPHIRPSAPANPPAPRSTPAKRVLNENEKKIARFNGWTDDEYIAWTDNVRPNEVAHISDDDIKSRMK